MKSPQEWANAFVKDSNLNGQVSLSIDAANALVGAFKACQREVLEAAAKVADSYQAAMIKRACELPTGLASKTCEERSIGAAHVAQDIRALTTGVAPKPRRCEYCDCNTPEGDRCMCECHPLCWRCKGLRVVADGHGQATTCATCTEVIGP